MMGEGDVKCEREGERKRMLGELRKRVGLGERKKKRITSMLSNYGGIMIHDIINTQTNF